MKKLIVIVIVALILLSICGACSCEHEWIIIEETESTCTVQGIKIIECSICETRDEEKKELLSHDYHIKEEVEANCNKEGYTLQVCKECGYEEKINIIAKLAHRFLEWETITESTCTVQGMKVHKCDECGYTEGMELPLIAHDYYICEEVQADCVNDGYTIKICNVCNHKEKTNIVDKLGHTFSEWKVVVEATEDSEGLKERVCSSCDIKEVKSIEKLILEVNFEKIYNNTTTLEEYKSTINVSFMVQQLFSEKGIKLSGTLETYMNETQGNVILDVIDNKNNCGYEYPIYNIYNVPYSRLILENGKYIYIPIDFANIGNGIIAKFTDEILDRVAVIPNEENMFMVEIDSTEYEEMYGKLVNFFVNYADEQDFTIKKLKMKNCSIRIETDGKYITNYEATIKCDSNKGTVNIKFAIKISK